MWIARFPPSQTSSDDTSSQEQSILDLVNPESPIDQSQAKSSAIPSSQLEAELPHTQPRDSLRGQKGTSSRPAFHLVGESSYETAMCISLRSKGPKPGEEVYGPRQVDQDATSFRRHQYAPSAHIQRDTARLSKQHVLRKQQAAHPRPWRKNERRHSSGGDGGGAGDPYGGGVPYYAVMPSHDGGGSWGGHHGHHGHDSGGSWGGHHGHDSGGGGGWDSGGGGDCGGGGDGGGGGGGD